MDPERLLQECDVETLRRSGNGGQHRNKTESAVRVVHRASGLAVVASERRSQAQNLSAALERLGAKLEARAKVKKKRVPTKVSRAAKVRRVEAKKKRAVVKSTRRVPENE